MNGNECEHLERPAVVITPLAFVIVLQRNGAGASESPVKFSGKFNGWSCGSLHFYRSKCFAKCVCFFGCDFEIPMIAVKGDITEDSRDIEIHCVLFKWENVVFVCGWFEISILAALCHCCYLFLTKPWNVDLSWKDFIRVWKGIANTTQEELKKSSAEALPGGKSAVCPNPVFFLPWLLRRRP